MNNAATLLCAIACGLAAAAGEKTADLDRVVFVLNSQPNSFHHSIAAETKEGIKTALTGADVAPPHHVYSVADHADEIPLHGAWTYFPVIEALAAKFTGRNDLADWFVFLEEGSDVKVDVLAEMLGSHSPDDDVFLGHSLEDDDHVVIHHYDKPGEIKFPLADAGFVLSRAVVDRVKREYERLMEDEASKMPKDFSIDPVYELAKALKHLFDGMDVHPVLVRNDTRLCHEAAEASACAVRPRVRPACAEDQALDDAKTLFAVKTCKQFHKERLTVIKDTWAKAATNVKYFSEEEDADFETVVLPGVANTERGHCGKTLAIIKYFNENAGVEGWEWLVIADDDTMLGVHKMLGHLSCYDSKDFVALGQRYGFRIASGKYGYDYLTGGGGMVFSAALVSKMMSSGHCNCPTPDTPDDMHLGACMSHLGVSVTHSARFHQARPEDYHDKLLRLQDPVSFHKFWNTDPRKIYAKWFEPSDRRLTELKFNTMHRHTEL